MAASLAKLRKQAQALIFFTSLGRSLPSSFSVVRLTSLFVSFETMVIIRYPGN